MRSEFDLNPRLIYLNSGSLSIAPRSVVEAVTRHQLECERNPTGSLFGTWEKLWDVQKRVAGFFGAAPSDFILRPNVTIVMNDFILGAPLPAGSEIALTDLEYGAISNACRFRAEKDGLKIRKVVLPHLANELRTVTREQLVERILSQLTPETKMLVVSHVITGNGLILPIEDIARQTRARGILLAVDGAHAPGALALDFRKLGDVDFYGGNLHKWMMGPKGTAFGWVAPRNQESLTPREPGWTTFETPPAFSRFGEGNRFAARFLMASSHDFSPFYALEEMVAFWEKWTPEQIRHRIIELQSLLENLMAEKLGWPLLSPPAGPLRGPLITFQLPEPLEKLGYGLMHGLLERGLQIVTTSVKGKWCLRLSPHVYNSEDDCRRALEILINSMSISGH